MDPAGRLRSHRTPGCAPGRGTGDRGTLLDSRINALRIRGQKRSVRDDRADRLNSPTKKMVYLFLKEFFQLDPDLAYDELAADEWVFEQMGRVGMLDP